MIGEWLAPAFNNISTTASCDALCRGVSPYCSQVMKVFYINTSSQNLAGQYNYLGQGNFYYSEGGKLIVRFIDHLSWIF